MRTAITSSNTHFYQLSNLTNTRTKMHFYVHFTEYELLSRDLIKSSTVCWAHTSRCAISFVCRVDLLCSVHMFGVGGRSSKILAQLRTSPLKLMIVLCILAILSMSELTAEKAWNWLDKTWLRSPHDWIGFLGWKLNFCRLITMRSAVRVVSPSVCIQWCPATENSAA